MVAYPSAQPGVLPPVSVRLSVVVPCYNEEEVLHELLRRLTAECVQAAGDSYEIVLVNDGSRDRTWPMMVEACTADPRVVAVNLSRNHGHQLALSAGLSVTRGARVFIIDADLQDPPELLHDMMARMEAGADVVYGQRRTRAGESGFKLFTASLFYRTLRAVTDVDIPADTGDFRLMTRRVLTHLVAMPERQRFIRGMVAWLGFRQEPLLYDRAARYAGTTKYPLRKMLLFAADAITGFSVAPLRFSLLLATIGIGVALLLAAYSVSQYLSSRVVPGWASITFSIAAFSSLQLIMLGVVGEYVGRMFLEMKQRPQFLIAEVRTTDESVPHA